jgi:hypothetical protein
MFGLTQGLKHGLAKMIPARMIAVSEKRRLNPKNPHTAWRPHSLSHKCGQITNY